MVPLTLVLLATTHPSLVVALPHTLPAAVPQDVVAAWFVDSKKPESEPGSLNSIGLARLVIDQAGEFGLLSGVDPVGRAWIDTLAALSVVLEHPHAVALFHVRSSKLSDGGHRLAALYGALIVHTRGENSAIEHRIQRLLNTYTNSDESILTTTEHARQTVFELRDRRLPEWMSIRWGSVGEYYVVALGDGSFDRVVETLESSATALGGNPWFQSAFEKLRGPDAWFAAWADFHLLQTTSDVGLSEKVTRVRDTLALRDVAHGLWTVRYQDRAVYAEGYVRVNGHDQLRPLTKSELAGIRADELVPKDATGYALFDVTPRQVLGLVSEAYLASRGERARHLTSAYWQELQATAGVSIETDLLARLGHGVVIHNSPQHALGLPLLWTVATPVRGDPAELRKALDALFRVWQSELLEAGGPAGLRQDAAGAWYLDLGINGPAAGMTDRWLVVSFSPEAVRANLDLLDRVGGARESGPVARTGGPDQ